MRTITQKTGPPAATLLAVKKTYPRVNRPILWSMLKKYGMKEENIRLLKGLHEETEYRVKAKGKIVKPGNH